MSEKKWYADLGPLPKWAEAWAEVMDDIVKGFNNLKFRVERLEKAPEEIKAAQEEIVSHYQRISEHLDTIDAFNAAQLKYLKDHVELVERVEYLTRIIEGAAPSEVELLKRLDKLGEEADDDDDGKELRKSVSVLRRRLIEKPRD